MAFITNTRNRYYEQVVGNKILAFNIQVIGNQLYDRTSKEKVVAKFGLF